MKTKITKKLITKLCLIVLLILPLSSSAQRKFKRMNKYQVNNSHHHCDSRNQNNRWNVVPRMDQRYGYNHRNRNRIRNNNFRHRNRQIPNGMQSNVFQYLQNSMNSASFDRNKLDVAKMAIRNNGISTTQLRTLMRKLSFDSNKLALAKYSLPYTYDRNLFFSVTDELTFYSNRRSLMNHINNSL